MAQISGTIKVAGLAAPVRIVRDRWGVPHIYADSQDDLFFAQGFVQAQDRLFQMDLWRRSVQGRLAQVLGANFIERDAMTRRIQFRGDPDADGASYGPDALEIATAFTRGINAWVARARERPPEEFVLAGWKPEFWSPTDLLNRTDAFLSSGDAVDEVRRERLSDVIAEAIGRVGTAPFFSGLAADVTDPGGVRLQPDATPDRSSHAVSRAAASRGGVLSLSEARRAYITPSHRYFVHLKAPGWNVIGATAPWLPGVALGHNERIAWGMAPLDIDTQDVFVQERVGGMGRRGGTGEVREKETTIVTDAIVVKGRRTRFAFETELTPHGIVIAVDRERGRAFTLRWRGWEAGAAAELGALALDRAGTWEAFRAALERWKMPARRVAYADVDGNIGFQDAALADRLAHALNPGGGVAAPAAASREVPSAGAQAVFVHVLGISDPARRRFQVGPIHRRSGDDSAVQATFDPRNWDASRAITAPGQSESPASPHFRDLSTLWAEGAHFPLAFSDAAVAANGQSTLTLVPKTAVVQVP